MGLQPLSIPARILSICLIGVISGSLSSASANDELQSTPWKLSADRLTHQQEPQKVVAEGEVVLEQVRQDTTSPVTLKADRIEYDIESQTVSVLGNLQLNDEYDEIKASKAAINLDSQTGSFADATLLRGQYRYFISADYLEKTGRETFFLQNGKFTTCPIQEDRAPDWSIWGKEVRVTDDGYARLKHSTMRIKDFPVFYLPYLKLPTKNYKKSGLLFPEYSSSSRHGTGIIAPLFINLSPSYDMTLYPGYYSERGPLIGGEFRYMTGIRSKGTFLVNYLDDKLEDTPEDEYKSDGYLRTNSTRYWVRGKADHDFGNRLVGRLDVDFVSDRDYLQEFKKGMIGYDESQKLFLNDYNRGFQAETVHLRENSLQLAKIWSTTDLQAEINIIDDVRDDPLEITPAWALPRLVYSGLLPVLQSPVDLTWGSEYVFFWRDEGVGGHRIDLFPQLNGPLNFSSFLESSYLIGLRETLYFIEPFGEEAEDIWANKDFENRTLFNFNVNFATTFVRDFNITKEKPRTFRHAVRPEISYLYVSDADQDDLPEFDSVDNIAGRNWLHYNLNNYFRIIGSDETSLFRTNFSSFKISQVYDIDEDEHPFADLYLELVLRGKENLYFRYRTTVSMYGEGVTTYSLESRYAGKKLNRFNLDYRYKRDPQIESPFFYTEPVDDSLHEINIDLRSKLSHLFSAGLNLTYSFSSSNTVDSTLSLIYHPACWSLEFNANKTFDDTSFSLLFSLSGLGEAIKFGLPEF
jgi:LPS-assembly protein